MSTNKARPSHAEDMQPEYDFDYTKAKPNRFAGRISKDRVVVLLDPEVSKVFTDSKSVNAALRALITALLPLLKEKLASSISGSVELP
jgi:hypothetical protein